MENPNIKKFYQQAAKPFNYVPNDLVEGSPTTPPLMSGLMRIDPQSGNIWISAGNKFVSDWKVITGGGGGSSITLQTNGISNADQTALNLQEGTGITLTDNGTGTVTVDLSSVIPTVVMLDTNVTFDADTTPNNIGNFSFNVITDKSYYFKVVLSFSLASSGDTGVLFGATDIGGSYAQTAVNCSLWPSTGGYTQPYIALNDSLSNQGFNMPTSGYNAKSNIAVIEGVLTAAKSDSSVTIAGYGKVTGGFTGLQTVTVNAGSTLILYELP